MGSSTNKKVVLSIRYILLTIAAISVIYPLVFIVFGSLKTETELFAYPFALPQSPNWKVYYDVLFTNKFMVNIANSLYYSVCSVVLSLLVCYLASYGISRMRWKLSGVAMGILMIGIFIPLEAMILPLYLTTREMGMSNPRMSLPFIYAAFSLPRTIFILIAFLRDIPRSLEESAVIDGSSIWGAMFRIIMPVMKPAVATVCIFNFLGVWNDLFLSLIFISKNSQMTIQTGLLKFQGVHSTQYANLLAGVVIVIVPILIVYVFFQKYIISGMTSGAIKG